MSAQAAGCDAALATGTQSAQSRLPADWPNRRLSRFVTVAERRWHVQQGGAGPSVLLLHGTGASTHSWRGLLPLLLEDCKVLAVDLPGHAYTERCTEEALSLSGMSQSVAALLDSLSFRPSVVIGHSAGAALAVRMSLDDRLSANHIVGLNAALLPFGGAWQPVISPLARLCASTGLLPKMLASMARDPNAVKRMLRSTGSVIDAEGLAQYRQLLQRESHIRTVLKMMANWDLSTLLEDLPRLDAHLSLFTGSNDTAVRPEQARAVQKVFPAAHWLPINGCGHLAHEEQPALIAGLIRKQVADLVPSAGAQAC